MIITSPKIKPKLPNLKHYKTQRESWDPGRAKCPEGL